MTTSTGVNRLLNFPLCSLPCPSPDLPPKMHPPPRSHTLPPTTHPASASHPQCPLDHQPPGRHPLPLPPPLPPTPKTHTPTHHPPTHPLPQPLSPAMRPLTTLMLLVDSLNAFVGSAGRPSSALINSDLPGGGVVCDRAGSTARSTAQQAAHQNNTIR